MFKKALIWGIILGLMAGISQAEWWKFWEKEKPKKKIEQQRVVQKSSKNIKTQNLQSRGSSKQNKKTSTDPAQQLLDEGDKLLSQCKFDEAIAKYQELMESYPESPLVINTLERMSYCYVSKGHYKKGDESAFHEAINIEKKILEKYPDSSRTIGSYFNIALIYRELKDYENGIKWFQKSIEKYTEAGKSIAKSLQGLAECYYYNKNYGSATITFQRIIDEYPNANYVKGYGVKYWIGCCYEAQGKLDDALEVYKEVLEKGDPLIVLYPDWITYHIGEIYEYKKDYKNAKIWYQKVIDGYPDSEWADDAKEKLEGLELNKERNRKK